MRLATALVVVAVLAVSTSAQPGGREHVLDLTAPGVRFTPASPSGGSGGAMGYSGQRSQRIPLELQLTSVDRSELEIGGPAIYEVSLKNISDAAVPFPWSVDLAAVYAGGEPTVRASLALAVVASDNPNAKVAVVSLAGSPTVDGSILHLAPKDTAVIRMKGDVLLPQELAERLLGLGVTPVRAELSLRTEPHVIWQPLLSKNAVPLEFLFRR